MTIGEAMRIFATLPCVSPPPGCKWIPERGWFSMPSFTSAVSSHRFLVNEKDESYGIVVRMIAEEMTQYTEEQIYAIARNKQEAAIKNFVGSLVDRVSLKDLLQ